jgi:hypothetical protein
MIPPRQQDTGSADAEGVAEEELHDEEEHEEGDEEEGGEEEGEEEDGDITETQAWREVFKEMALLKRDVLRFQLGTLTLQLTHSRVPV